MLPYTNSKLSTVNATHTAAVGRAAQAATRRHLATKRVVATAAAATVCVGAARTVYHSAHTDTMRGASIVCVRIVWRLVTYYSDLCERTEL